MNDVKDKKVVLLVDDAPANIQIVNSILKDDYKIRIATSGAKALDLVKTAPLPNLVLLDVMMPEMDGYELCTIMKATPEVRDIPVIFLTGQTRADDETRGFEVGAVDYIHKPFSPSVVKARVNTHLVLREMREQLARQLFSINNELEMARQIQLSILPHEIPKIPGLEIAVRYIPMSSVAGDFYDFVVVDEKHIGILIADVTGHGLPAALIASMLQSALCAQAVHASDPGRVLAGLNHALCGKFDHNFVTAAYAYIDMEERTLTYAAAGHPPMLICRNSNGKVEEILENGLFLGMFPEAAFASVKTPFASGDRVVLYTDGILEAPSSSEEEFGAERLSQFMETKHSLTLNRFADALIDALFDWTQQPRGQGQQDDITLLAVDFKECR
jgi:sigma-B regulation protein RsbU (phosphoserine phosphatase)